MTYKAKSLVYFFLLLCAIGMYYIQGENLNNINDLEKVEIAETSRANEPDSADLN